MRLVGHDADAVGDRAGGAGGGGQEVGVAVVDRVAAQRRARVAELGAGGDDHDARPRARARRSRDRRRRACRGGAARGPCPPRASMSPSAMSSPARRTCWPGAGAAADPHAARRRGRSTRRARPRRAGRHRGAGHDLDRGARATAPASGLAGADLADDGQVDRACPRWRRRRPRRPRRSRPSRSCRSSAARSVRRRPRRSGRPSASISGCGKAGSGETAARIALDVLVDGAAGQPSVVLGRVLLAQHACRPRPAGRTSAASATSPTTRTPWPKVQSPSTVSDSASRSDGAPSGKRLSKSPTSL